MFSKAKNQPPTRTDGDTSLHIFDCRCGLALLEKNANNQLDKEDSCRDKKDSVKSSLPLHHIVAKPQSCIGEQCAPALCRGFFMYTGVHECTRHFRHKNAPNCENSGRFVYIFVYAFRKPLTLNVYCGERGTNNLYIIEYHTMPKSLSLK